MKKTTAWIPIAVFVTLIFGGLIWGTVKEDQAYSDTENRYLASRPEFTWSSLLDGSFTKEYESYITDQFPERDRWIGLKTRTELALGKVETKGVWLAKDGYLIVDYPASDFQSEQAGKNKEALAKALAYYADVLGESHVRVLLIPTASQILTDKLPKNCLRYDQSAYVRQVKEAVRKQTGIEALFVDAESVLTAHGEEYIFYRTDHHWTTLGAYYVYQAWAQSVGITPVGDSELTVVSENFLGTTYSKLHTAEQADTISVFDTDTPVTLIHNLTEETEGFYDWSALAKRDQYAVFLGGNDGLLEIRRESGAKEETAGSPADRLADGPAGGKTEDEQESVLLVVKDSFANCFIPYAAEHYDRILVADLRYLNMSLKALTEQYGVTDLLVLYNVQAFATDISVFKINR